MSTNRHRSCWDCDHLRVAGMPRRRCNLHREKHIWSCDADTEALEARNEARDLGEELTVADQCSDFRVAAQLFGVMLVGDEQEIS